MNRGRRTGHLTVRFVEAREHLRQGPAVSPRGSGPALGTHGDRVADLHHGGLTAILAASGPLAARGLSRFRDDTVLVAIRLATFNVENLFARWKFRAGIEPAEANKTGWEVDETLFDELSVDEKALTGMAIRELEADVLALQEVENVDTLKHFRAGALGGRKAYPYVAGIDGNDPRLIDVAVLSKLPITHVRSHQHLLDPETRSSTLFSRDCLEVDVTLPEGGSLTLFVNHFKSMLGGRDKTRAKRLRQARAVREIVTERFGADAGGQSFAILGDFNDYLEEDEQGTTGIADLVGWEELANVVERLPEQERWTHFWSKGKAYHQLDYLLLSRSLAEANPGSPEIMRMGMPLRAERYEGERFVGVGRDKPKASDHCPVVMELSSGA